MADPADLASAARSNLRFPDGAMLGRLRPLVGGSEMLGWSAEGRGNAVVVRATGRVDEATWEDFGARLRQEVATARSSPAGKLVIDLSEVAYMSSRGLRALTLVKREADAAQVGLVLAAPNDTMREILAISRYDKIFSIADTVEAAL